MSDTQEQEKQQAQQQLNHLVNYRAACAMNNLGCLIQSQPDMEYTDAVKNARVAAELLMVELKMITSTDFFRELEKFVKQPQQEQSSIVTE